MKSSKPWNININSHDKSFFSTTFIFQADRYLDRKLDQAEDLMKKKQKNAKKWYSNFIGDKDGPKLNEFHIFVISFAAGIALGVGSA